MDTVEIKTEFIKLEQLLKLANVCGSGGEAKLIIQEGAIKVNGVTETQRGKKIRKGDIISIDGNEELKVV